MATQKHGSQTGIKVIAKILQPLASLASRLRSSFARRKGTPFMHGLGPTCCGKLMTDFETIGATAKFKDGWKVAVRTYYCNHCKKKRTLEVTDAPLTVVQISKEI